MTERNLTPRPSTQPLKMNMKRLSALLCCIVVLNTQAQDWRPVGDRIKTPWSDKVDPTNPLPEYPLPAGTLVTTGSVCGLVYIRGTGHVVATLGDDRIEFDIV